MMQQRRLKKQQISMIYDCVPQPLIKEQPTNITHRRVPKKPFYCFYIPILTNLFVFCAVGTNTL